MLSSYFSQAIGVLASWDNNAHTTQQYAMAMLYGLNNSGLDPTNTNNTAEINLLNTEYNNIMSQYGITSTTWNTFIASQLIATTAAAKLPTNCPQP